MRPALSFRTSVLAAPRILTSCSSVFTIRTLHHAALGVNLFYAKVTIGTCRTKYAIDGTNAIFEYQICQWQNRILTRAFFTYLTSPYASGNSAGQEVSR